MDDGPLLSQQKPNPLPLGMILVFRSVLFYSRFCSTHRAFYFLYDIIEKEARASIMMDGLTISYNKLAKKI